MSGDIWSEITPILTPWLPPPPLLLVLLVVAMAAISTARLVGAGRSMVLVLMASILISKELVAEMEFWQSTVSV